MICSLDLHPSRYQLTTAQRLIMPLVSVYALRHFALANQETSPCKRLAHRVIAVIELIPIVGLFASFIERIIIFVRDCLFPEVHKKSVPIIDETFPNEIQRLIYNKLTVAELEKLNVELNQTDEVVLRALRDNILTENPEYHDAVKFWDRNEISLKDQISRLNELRECIFGTDKWMKFLQRLEIAISAQDLNDFSEPLRYPDKKKACIEGEIPKLPEDIYELMNRKDSNCDSKIKETHLLTLIPKSIYVHYTIDLSLEFFINLSLRPDIDRLVQEIVNPFAGEGEKLFYETVEKAHWSFIKIRLNQRGVSIEELQYVISQFNLHNQISYKFPKLIDILVSLLLNSHRQNLYVERFCVDSFAYDVNQKIYAICQEKVFQNNHTAIVCEVDNKMIYLKRNMNHGVPVGQLALERSL